MTALSKRELGAQEGGKVVEESFIRRESYSAVEPGERPDHRRARLLTTSPGPDAAPISERSQEKSAGPSPPSKWPPCTYIEEEGWQGAC